MNSEYQELWDAMKSAKYAQTFENLTKVINNSKEDLYVVMPQVLEIVCSAMHTEVGTLWYCDRRTDSLIRPLAAIGGGDISGIALPIGEGIAGQVVQTNKSAVIYDCQSDPRWAGEVASESGFITKTMICVPLSSEKGVAYGCIQLINKLDNTLFDEKDVELATMLAEVIADGFNKYGLEGSTERKTKEAIDLLVKLKNVDSDILKSAVSQMPGYSRLGNLQKKIMLNRIVNLIQDI